MTPILSVQNLSKRYGTTEAVKNVSFDVAGGEVVGLLGPNGAGKTTTVECILGLRIPDMGRVLVGGRDAQADPVHVRRHVGAQLQNTRFQDEATPLELLDLFGAFHHPSPSSSQTLVRFGLSETGNTPYRALSGGQKQRLSLALAFHHAPRLVILDEPTPGLDPAARRSLLDDLRAVRDRTSSILICTHQLDDARRICDRVIILNQGEVLIEGTPDAVIARAETSPRIHFRASVEVDAHRLTALNGVISSGQDSEGQWIATNDPNSGVMALADLLTREDNALLSLRIQRPSLEEAFLQLTGFAHPGEVSEISQSGEITP